MEFYACDHCKNGRFFVSLLGCSALRKNHKDNLIYISVFSHSQSWMKTFERRLSHWGASLWHEHYAMYVMPLADRLSCQEHSAEAIHRDWMGGPGRVLGASEPQNGNSRRNSSKDSSLGAIKWNIYVEYLMIHGVKDFGVKRREFHSTISHFAIAKILQVRVENWIIICYLEDINLESNLSLTSCSSEFTYVEHCVQLIIFQAFVIINYFTVQYLTVPYKKSSIKSALISDHFKTLRLRHIFKQISRGIL